MSSTLRTSRKKLVVCFFVLLPLLWASQAQAQCTASFPNGASGLRYWSQLTWTGCSNPNPGINGSTYIGNVTITNISSNLNLIIDIDITVDGSLILNSTNGANPTLTVQSNKTLTVTGNVSNASNNMSYTVETGANLVVGGTLTGKNNNLFSGTGTIQVGTLQVNNGTECGTGGCPTLVIGTCSSGDNFCVRTNQCSNPFTTVTPTANLTTISCGNTSQISANNPSGTSISSWQYSIAPFTNWIDYKPSGIYLTSNTFTTIPLYETTRFRAKVYQNLNKTCYILSGEITITVTPGSGSATISGANSFCQGSTPTDYTPSASGPYSWTISSAKSIGSTTITATTTGLNPATVTWDPGFYGPVTITAAATANCYLATYLVDVNPVGGGWLGKNSNWYDPVNWCGGVPTNATDVYISVGPNVVMPEIDPANGSGAICRDLLIASGASLTLTGSSTLNINGDFTNNGLFSSNSSTVSFVSPISQAINSPTPLTFHSLTINKVANDITLNAKIQVGGELKLIKGRIDVVGNNSVVLSTSATLSGGSFDSFVIGEMAYETSSSNIDIFFPVGNNINAYRPISLHLTQQNAGDNTYAAKIITGEPSSRTFPSTLTNAYISTVRYVYLTQINSIPFSGASIQIGYGTDDGVSAPSDLRLVKSNTSDWEDLGGLAISTQDGSGSITSTENFTSLGDFVLASTSESLPITLLNFSAAYEPDNRRVKLNWTTIREINNDFFTIERSPDAIHFEATKEIKGAGNTAERLTYTTYDENPLPGTSYYRLRQTDFNGTHTYSKLVAIQNGSLTRNDFIVAPNPFNGRHLNLLLSGEPMTEITVVLYGSLGQTIYEGQVSVDANNRAEVSLGQQLTPGIYWLKVGQGSRLSTRRVLVINP
jgi:hypothetical protein